MIILSYPRLTPQVQGWQQRLVEMVLAHELRLQPELSSPRLENEQDQAQGEASIEAYLDELEHILEQWYACRCD